MKYLVMLYNYPHGFYASKEDFYNSNLDLEEDELDNVEFIEIIEGEI